MVDTQREKIRGRSARLFAHKGFDDTSISDIAEEVDLSKATIYHYYASKDEIYADIIIDALDRLVKHSVAAVARASGPEKQLRAFMEAHARFFEDNFWSFTAMLIGFGGMQRRNERARAVQLRDDYERSLRAILAAGVESRVFRNVDPVTASRAVLSMLNWMARWFKLGGDKRAHEFAREYADLIVIGLQGAGRDDKPAAKPRTSNGRKKSG